MPVRLYNDRKPLLDCNTCKRLRPHEFAAIEIAWDHQWLEVWTCRVCGGRRVWGASDPKFYDRPLVRRRRHKTQHRTRLQVKHDRDRRRLTEFLEALDHYELTRCLCLFEEMEPL